MKHIVIKYHRVRWSSIHGDNGSRKPCYPIVFFCSGQPKLAPGFCRNPALLASLMEHLFHLQWTAPGDSRWHNSKAAISAAAWCLISSTILSRRWMSGSVFFLHWLQRLGMWISRLCISCKLIFGDQAWDKPLLKASFVVHASCFVISRGRKVWDGKGVTHSYPKRDCPRVRHLKMAHFNICHSYRCQLEART